MKVAAIIPAYNEAKTISAVVKVAKSNILIDEVFVVDDGSLDKTAAVAREVGANVVRIKNNQGKGRALEIGVQRVDSEILLFLDADLVGLTSGHIDNLLKPVMSGEADMTVGAIDRKMFGIFLDSWLRRTESPFSGMRAIKRDFWDKIPKCYKKKFYIESAITYLAKENKLRIKPLILDGVNHIIKEKKMGFWKGTKERCKMNAQIILINLFLKMKTRCFFKNS